MASLETRIATQLLSRALQGLAIGGVVVALCCIVIAQENSSIFQAALTSSGRNRPAISMAKDDLDKLSVLLHRRVPRNELSSRLGVSEEEVQRRLDLLVGEGLATIVPEGRVLPTSMVVTFEDAPRYLRPDDRLVEEAARLVVKRLPVVKARLRTLPSLANVPFDSMSFFIVSDVLLDNWQISSVERLFAKGERTQRTGGRYYYTILEKSATDPTEPFGLYGNTGSQWGPVQVGLYGNDRFSGHTLLSISNAAFNPMFGFPGDMSPTDARSRLGLGMAQALGGESSALTPMQWQALASLGLATNDRLTVLSLTEGDYKALDRVAATVTNDLVSLLERNRSRILTMYRASPYVDEASPNEYLMCWYHFFYAAVTNRLRDTGAIHVPVNGTMTFFVVP